MELSVNSLNATLLFRTEDLFTVYIVNSLGGKRLFRSGYITDYQIHKWISLQSSTARPRVYFMIQWSRTILIFQYHCQIRMAVLYFTWPAWTQGSPKSQRVTHFDNIFYACTFHTQGPQNMNICQLCQHEDQSVKLIPKLYLNSE